MHQLGVLLAFTAACVGQTTLPAVGNCVVLKESGVRLVKDCDIQPAEVTEQTDGALFCVVDVRGDWLWVHTDRGMGWVHRGDVLLPEDADAFFNARIRANARDTEAWGRRGVARTTLGDVASRSAADASMRKASWTEQNGEGLRDLAEAIRLDPTDPRWLHRRAQCYIVLNELDKAMADATEAARLSPKNAQLVALQGVIWHQGGNMEKAGECAEAALHLDQGCAEAHCLRGMVQQAARKVDGALADYDKAIELNPGEGDAYTNRALLLWDLRSYDRVIDDATACLRLKVRPAQAYRLRGLAWYMKRDPNKALTDLDASLRLEPRDKSALMGRAGVKRVKGDLAGAVEDMKRAAASDPDDLTILPVLAQGQLECRNWNDAMAALQTWVARAPNDPRPHGGLADLYATCPDSTIRDGKKAVECATRACELTQWKNPFPIDTLATACAMAGDLAGAVHWEKVALEGQSFAARNGAEARHRLKQYEAMLAAVTVTSPAVEGEVDESRITWENYEKIKCGMTLSEVVEILGPGRRVGGRSFDWVWAPKKAPTLIRVMFDDDGKVGSKAQIGLGARN